MDAYKTPTSDLHVEFPKEHKPITGILIGLFFVVIVMNITSTLLAIIFGALLGADFTVESWTALLATNNAYLLTDLSISAIVCFYAGRAVGKRTPKKEIYFGVILAIINIAIYLPIFIYTDAFTTYPSWYNALSFIVNFSIIPLGASSAANT